MINAATSHPRSTAAVGTTDQLSLLPDAHPVMAVSSRFQLSRATRERGLRHVAEIREMLAARAPSTTGDIGRGASSRPIRHDRAA